jgi:hypothetical protein
MSFRRVVSVSLIALGGCSTGELNDDGLASVEQQLYAVHDSIVAAMVAATPSGAWLTSEWQGVNLNGTPMNAGGFEGEDRVMEYDSIHVIDRNVRLYDGTAALRWHAEFFVKVNGRPSFAEMRILDVFVLRDGRWLNDLTQVTPIFGTVGNPPARDGAPPGDG